MGKARTALKVTSAGAATAIYAGSVYAAFKMRMIEDKPPVDYKAVAIAAGALTALTWIAALA